VEVHFYDFVEDIELTNRLLAFIDANLLNSTEDLKQSGQSLKTALKKKVFPSDPTDNESLLKDAPVPILPSLFNGEHFDFIDIDPLEIVRQLCIIDYEKFQKIPPKEFLNQKWNKEGKEKEAPGIVSVTKRFNKMSFWVTTLIVKVASLKTRAAMLKRFIEIADNCLKLNNFASAVTVLSGLESSSVHRLKKTWELISPETTITLTKLKQVISPDKSYKHYREQLHKAVGACVPYLGVYLQDLTFIEDGNPDFLKDTKLINFEKRAMISKVTMEIQQFQQLGYKLKPVSALQTYLHKLDFLTEKEAYAESLRVEPRDKVVVIE